MLTNIIDFALKIYRNFRRLFCRRTIAKFFAAKSFFSESCKYVLFSKIPSVHELVGKIGGFSSESIVSPKTNLIPLVTGDFPFLPTLFPYSEQGNKGKVWCESRVTKGIREIHWSDNIIPPKKLYFQPIKMWPLTDRFTD